MSSALGAHGSSPLQAFKGSALTARALSQKLEGLLTHDFTIQCHYNIQSRLVIATDVNSLPFPTIFDVTDTNVGTPTVVWQDEGLAHLLQVWFGQHGNGQLGGPLRWFPVDGNGGVPTTTSTWDSSDYDLLDQDSSGFGPSGTAIGFTPQVEITSGGVEYVTWRHAFGLNLAQFAVNGTAKSVHGLMLAPPAPVASGVRVGILFVPAPTDIPDLDSIGSPAGLFSLGIGRATPFSQLGDFNGWYVGDHLDLPEPTLDLTKIL